MKTIKKVIFIILLSFCIILPNKINALQYTSDFIKIADTSYTNTDEDVSFSQVYFNKTYSNFGDLISYGTLFGKMTNLSNNYLSVFMTIDYYDKNYKIIARSTKTEQPRTAKDNYSMNIILYANDFLENNDINDIAYFRINYYTVKGNLLPGADNIDSSNITNKPDTTGNGEYAITKYDIKINVNENNTFNIDEGIRAYFNVPKHGIYRKLPLRNKVVRLDGTTSNNKAIISDVKANTTASMYDSDGFRVIKLGDPNSTLTGYQDYGISYIYDIGKDTGKGYDEFYFNIIGDSFDTTVSDVSFTIIMPKEFDTTKLGFSSGLKGSIDSSNISYQVSGNVITGTYKGTLQAKQALTVRIELPDGYFTGARDNFDIMTILAIILPVIFAIISILLWYLFGRDEKAVETVEFYPPVGFNSAEIGFLYRGLATREDVVSLLIYLANKGYIKITETEEKSVLTKTKGFKITKLKEYDGDNLNERLFLTGLFRRNIDLFDFEVDSFGDIIDYMKNPQAKLEEKNEEIRTEYTSVTLDDLYDNFYTTLNNIISNINSKDNKEKIFTKSSLSKKTPIILMIIFTYFIISFQPIMDLGGVSLLIFGMIFPIVGFSIFYTTVFNKNSGPIYVNGRPSNSKVTKIFFGLAFGLGFGGVPWALMVLPGIIVDKMYIIAYIIGILSIIIMLLTSRFISKRTKYGTEILGKIKGFKTYLETVEKTKLQELVMYDPTYFYNILPYTYVLGISDKWIKKFEFIALEAPNWYESNSAFNTAIFGSFISSAMSSSSSAMSSSPSSSSSGGGSSGGGSGGGGGGSW